MWAQVVGAIIGTAAGAAAGAYQTKQQTNLKTKALKDTLINQALINKEFTGSKENDKLTAAGIKEANRMNQMNNASISNDTTKGNYLYGFNEGNTSGYDTGYGVGVENQAQLDQAQREQLETLNNAKLKQAGIDYDVKAAQNQALMNGIGNVASTAKTIGNPFKSNKQQGGNIFANKSAMSMQDPKFANQELASSDEKLKTCYMSDENNKEGINNDSGLPPAEIEDSLRQLETVQYKYKDPSIPGCDDEEHVGTTAQSLEKTELFKDCVKEGDDGYKRVDQWKLVEALTSGIAQLQREVDELESK